MMGAAIEKVINVTKLKWSWEWHMAIKYDKGDQPSGGKTTWTIREGHDLAEDSTRKTNLDTACIGLRPTTEQ